MSILELYQVNKMLGDRLLLTVDHLRVNAHERIGIVGRNGVGKSILLQMIAGEIEYDEGSISSHAKLAVIPQQKESDLPKSGGEITTIYIQQALRETTQLLLADEPTTHLDVATIEYVEQQLLRYTGAILLVSHDRAFLDRICTHIWEFENQKITVYKGNYSDYEAKKHLEKRQQEMKHQEYLSKVSQLETALQKRSQLANNLQKAPSKRMSTSETRNWKMHKASQQKSIHRTMNAVQTRLNKLEKVEKPTEMATVKLDVLHPATRKNQFVIIADRLVAEMAGRPLWAEASFQIKWGEKVALLGANGSGKSTLLKKIVGRDSDIQLAGTRIGYFSQNLDVLTLDKTILENVKETSRQTEQTVRDVLARLLFKQDAIYKTVRVLSGGEKVKVALAKIMVSDIDMMILDEPTTYLDTLTIQALEDLLTSYQGTVLFASHDRRFVSKVATKIMEISQQSITTFDGTYEDYMEYQQKKASEKDVVKDYVEELLQVEMQITEILYKLGITDKGEKATIQEQERHYQALLKQRARLKNLIGK